MGIEPGVENIARPSESPAQLPHYHDPPVGENHKALGDPPGKSGVAAGTFRHSP